MIGQRWMVSDAEVARHYPCDGLSFPHVVALWRGITIDAPTATVWAWLRQIQLAPYSYDCLDNLGFRSPQRLLPLTDPQPGEPMSRCAGKFAVGRVLAVAPGEHLTGVILGAAMSYVLVPDAGSTRLLLKTAAQPPSEHGRWRAPDRELSAAVDHPQPLSVRTSCYSCWVTSRARLMEAMADLLWERGYAATSPRDVMARAGVGQGSMYHHFTGKHELAVTALATVVSGMTQESSSLLGGDGSALERIKRYLSLARPGLRGCRVGRMTQDPEVVDDPALIAVVAGAFETVSELWEQVLTEAVDAGELPADTVPRDLARTLAAVIQGGYVLARAQGTQEPMDAAVRGAISLLDAASPANPHDTATTDREEKRP